MMLIFPSSVAPTQRPFRAAKRRGRERTGDTVAVYHYHDRSLYRDDYHVLFSNIHLYQEMSV